VVLAYGTIENTARNIVADYYRNPSFSSRCKNFAEKLTKENSHIAFSIKQEGFNNFVNKECNPLWLDELRRRQCDPTYMDLYRHQFRFSDMYGNNGATDSLSNARNSFSHGKGNYQGGMHNIIDYFRKSAAWLYEIDNIIDTIKG